MILAPLRQGFVEQDGRRVSYATRLRVLLELLFRPSQAAAEKTLMPALNFSEKLQTLYHFNYGVVDRLQGSELILSATFDSSWEMYFHNLVDNVGPFLDAVFFHCEGFQGRSCADGYEKFAEFIRQHQVQVGALYTANPELTADDLRQVRRFARGAEVETPLASVEALVEQDKAAWSARLASPEWQDETEYKRLRLQSIAQFLLSAWETRKLFGPHEQIDHRSAEALFDNAARFLAGALVDRVEYKGDGSIDSVVIDRAPQSLGQLKQALLAGAKDDACEAWIEQVLSPPRGPAGSRNRRNAAAAEADFSNVQRGIVELTCPRDEDAMDADARPDTQAALLSLLRLPKRNVHKFLDNLRLGLFPNTTAMTVNVGFTYSGLRRLGLGDETCELFPKEFQEGMEHRAGVLGDLGWPNHPDYWRPLGNHGWFSISSIDLVVIFHFEHAHAESTIVADAKDYLRQWIGDAHAECLVHSEFVDRTGADPFGFRPRLKRERSQPTIDWAKGTAEDANKDGYDNRIAPGDLILGYHDHRGEVAPQASGKQAASDLFKDGTFLVLRKLAQNVQAFRQHKDWQSEAATLGTYLAPDATYAKEPEKSYPLNSHIRRSNPRTKGTPRIVRQSYSYAASGKDDAARIGQGPEKGHMFMCYNASIGQQYEVIQRWINGGNSTGLLSSDCDPVAGQHAKGGGLPPTTLRWGMYLFVPSKRALELLRDLAEGYPTDFIDQLRAAEEARIVERGRALLKQLDAIQDPELAQQSWKQLFEEAASARDARAVWAAIRASGGQKDTPYGLLLGTREYVKRVLENKGDLYSVREYRERFLQTAGDFYLGLDECPAGREAETSGRSPGYTNLASANVVANEVLSSAAARASAANHTGAFFEQLEKARHGALPLADAPGLRFDVKQLVKYVIGNICADYTGVPRSVGREETLRSFLDHFIAITRYSSFPYPEKWVAERAARSGRALVEAYGNDPSTWSGALADRLIQNGYGAPEAVRDAVIIANVGFVPPAISMLTSMLSKWLNNGDIQQPRLRDPECARSAVLHEMTTDATFTTIYRTKIEHDRSGQPTPGKYVVVGVQSVYAQERQRGDKAAQRWMFGGTYAAPDCGARRGAHACPMQDQALEIIVGVTNAVASHVHERAKDNCALVRLSPCAYEFEPISLRLPRAYSTAL
jgi:Dyp-type peroxidase family